MDSGIATGRKHYLDMYKTWVYFQPNWDVYLSSIHANPNCWGIVLHAKPSG